MRAALILLPLAFLGATAARDTRSPADQARLAKALAGLVPGPTMACVPLTYPTLQTQAIGTLLLYKRDVGTVYVNQTTGGCESAANGDVLVQVEQQGRPCQGDIIRTVDPTSRMTTGSCALGQFTTYRRPSK